MKKIRIKLDRYGAPITNQSMWAMIEDKYFFDFNNYLLNLLFAANSKRRLLNYEKASKSGLASLKHSLD